MNLKLCPKAKDIDGPAQTAPLKSDPRLNYVSIWLMCTFDTFLKIVTGWEEGWCKIQSWFWPYAISFGNRKVSSRNLHLQNIFNDYNFCIFYLLNSQEVAFAQVSPLICFTYKWNAKDLVLCTRFTSNENNFQFLVFCSFYSRFSCQHKASHIIFNGWLVDNNTQGNMNKHNFPLNEPY